MNIKSGITVEKGSITISGISLTVVDSADQEIAQVCHHTIHIRTYTIMQYIQEGSTVNIEFDIVGKYTSEKY
ncbi:MAG: hypothetical protein R2852_03505 [Bacteroidia bacterium]